MAERTVTLRGLPLALENVRGREVLTVSFPEASNARWKLPFANRSDAVAAFRARELRVSVSFDDVVQ